MLLRFLAFSLTFSLLVVGGWANGELDLPMALGPVALVVLAGPLVLLVGKGARGVVLGVLLVTGQLADRYLVEARAATSLAIRATWAMALVLGLARTTHTLQNLDSWEALPRGLSVALTHLVVASGVHLLVWLPLRRYLASRWERAGGGAM